MPSRSSTTSVSGRKREALIEREACRRITLELGVESRKLTGHKGDPDRMFLVRGGRPVFIEFKAETGKLSLLQELTIKRWRQYGYEVHVCRSAAEALDILKEAVARSATSPA